MKTIKELDKRDIICIVIVILSIVILSITAFIIK